MLAPVLSSNKLSFDDIVQALAAGWSTFRAIPAVSLAMGCVFALIGLVVMLSVYRTGVSAMALPFAGGFMLLGPIFLAGFFRLSELHSRGSTPGFRDALAGFGRAPAGLWVVALICTFLFLVWITDAGILYSFLIGRVDTENSLFWLDQFQENVVAFVLWGSLMGSVLAFMAFAVSAFSVPLLYQHRATTAQAVFASVRAVLHNFVISITWGMLLAGSILLSILFLPLLIVVLPVMAYASFALYQRTFPPAVPDSGRG